MSDNDVYLDGVADGAASQAKRIAELEEAIRELQNLVESLKIERSVLRTEVRAARTLGDASPLALEYCKQQWLDAKQVTDTLGLLEDKQSN